MAHGHDPQPGEPTEHEHAHESHVKLYVIIFFFLLAVTAIEVLIPSTWLNLRLPHLLEKGLLLALMFIKGAGVMMFYMHLKGDRRMFGSLFVFPLIVVFGMILGFIALFQPYLW
jgi:cytochrome c oxidase subunit 4/cytochrome o ubiquinol oxidase operon protein cyoD